MKKILIVLYVVLLTGCSPEVGSEKWCSNMDEKSKGDWTAAEAGEYAKSCVFK
jgi:hypothetical protein